MDLLFLRAALLEIELYYTTWHLDLVGVWRWLNSKLLTFQSIVLFLRCVHKTINTSIATSLQESQRTKVRSATAPAATPKVNSPTSRLTAPSSSISSNVLLPSVVSFARRHNTVPFKYSPSSTLLDDSFFYHPTTRATHTPASPAHRSPLYRPYPRTTCCRTVGSSR